MGSKRHDGKVHPLPTIVKLKAAHDPAYLNISASHSHTNVVLVCEDGVQLKTSKVFLAANSTLMDKVLTSVSCGQSLSTCCQDDVKIWVPSQSTHVLEVLRFMHCGCFYSHVQVRHQQCIWSYPSYSS